MKNPWFVAGEVVVTNHCAPNCARKFNQPSSLQCADMHACRARFRRFAFGIEIDARTNFDARHIRFNTRAGLSWRRNLENQTCSSAQLRGDALRGGFDRINRLANSWRIEPVRNESIKFDTRCDCIASRSSKVHRDRDRTASDCVQER